MAWVNIPDTATDPDAPLTSSLAKAWTGNFQGMADGDPGAPRVTYDALNAVLSMGITDNNTLITNIRSNCFLIGGSVTVSASGVGSGGSVAAHVRLSTDGGVSFYRTIVLGVAERSSPGTNGVAIDRIIFDSNPNINAIAFRYVETGSGITGSYVINVASIGSIKP